MKNPSQKLAAASDPSTPAGVLEKLASSKLEAVRRAAGLNPNTPDHALIGVWLDHPECVLDNPVLSFWEFTGAGFPECMGLNTLFVLYNHLRETGRPLPAQIFTRDIMRKLVCYGISDRLPEIFRFMPFEESADLRARLVENAQYRGMFAFWEDHAPDAVWERMASDSDPAVRLGFAAMLRSCHAERPPRREISATAARMLFGDGRPEVLSHLANFRFLPDDLAAQLACSPDVETRDAVARCFSASARTMEKLAADPDERVRLSLASYCELDEIHKILLRDPSVKVRRRLAENRSVSLSTLELFSPLDAKEVVGSVIAARQADSALRERFIREGPPSVQGALVRMRSDYTPAFHQLVKPLLLPETLALLAEAPGLPRAVLEELAFDPDPVVRLAVATRLRNSHNTAKTQGNVVLLNRLASDPDPRVRLCVCIDWRLEQATREGLFRDPDPLVRQKCVRSILVTLEYRIRHRNHGAYRDLYKNKGALLCIMAGDPDPIVRKTIAESSEAPPRAYAILFDDPVEEIREEVRGKKRWPFGALIDMEKCHKRLLRGRPLAHGITTPGSGGLGILAKSPNPFLRLLTARCRRTAKADLKALAGDPHPAVRETALARLNPVQA